MKTLKKVWRYVKRYKKHLIISLLMILIGQVLNLVSPLIVKEILDEHLMGIEKPWVEVQEEDKYTVEYFGKYYKQERYVDDDDVVVGKASILMLDNKFYITDDHIVSGKKKLEGNTLIIDVDGEKYTYTITLLNKDQVKEFYSPSVPILKVLIILLFVRFFLSIIVNYIQRITSATITINVTRDARLDATKKIQSIPIDYFEKEPAGKLSNRIVHDVGGITSLFQTTVNLVITATMSFIFAYVGMFYLDWKLALLSFVIYPLVYFWLKFFVGRIRRVATKVSELNSLITANLNEIINGISIIQIFNHQKHTAKRFDDLNREFMNEHIKEVKLHLGLGWNMINFLRQLVTAFVVLYFGWNYFHLPYGAVTAGLIYAYNEYLLRLIDPITILFRDVGNIEHAIVKAERLFTIIDSPAEDSALYPIPRYYGDIKFENVWFSYNEKEYVLKGINLDIKAGEMVGIVGQTGSGKTTLMSLLLRFYDLKPTDYGRITVDGVDINTYPKRTYRQHIGIILQEPILFKGTIASNVKFGLDVPDEEVYNVLVKIGGKKLIDKFEDGIHHEVTRGGGNLSLGEKQLICFARVLLYDPAILVMDEATANIDTETEEMIQNALNVVAKGRTVIIIAHRLSTIKNADKIVVLHNGKKFEEGTHQELIVNNGIYANIYRSQVKLSQ